MIEKTTRKKRKYTPRKKVKKVEKPAMVFYGTPCEEKILKVCYKNKYPFDFRRAKIKGKVADFICREKRLVIEVYNPERSDEEVYERMKIFKIQRFKTCYITKHTLSRHGWEKFCAGIIKGFLT